MSTFGIPDPEQFSAEAIQAAVDAVADHQQQITDALIDQSVLVAEPVLTAQQRIQRSMMSAANTTADHVLNQMPAIQDAVSLAAAEQAHQVLSAQTGLVGTLNAAGVKTLAPTPAPPNQFSPTTAAPAPAQQQPIAADGWYCLRADGTVNDVPYGTPLSIVYYRAGDAPPTQAYATGPFADQQSAAASCGFGPPPPGGIVPAPSPSPAPPPPISLPPEQPLPPDAPLPPTLPDVPPADTTAAYWIWCAANGIDYVLFRQAQGEDPPTDPPLHAGGDQWDGGPWSGPWATQQLAESACALGPQPVDLSCEPWTIGADVIGAIPAPGSEEWCRDYDRTFALLRGVGQVIVGVVDNALGALQTNSDTLMVGQDSDDSVTRAVAAVVNSLWKSFRPAWEHVRCLLVNLVDFWRNANGVIAGCDKDAMVALAVLRGALRVLRKLRFGLSAPFELTIWIGTSIPPLQRAVEAVWQGVCVGKNPTVDQAVQYFLSDAISYEEALCFAKGNGTGKVGVDRRVKSQSQTVGPQQWLEHSYRTQGDDAGGLAALRARGWQRPADLQALAYLHWRLPPLAELIAWERDDVTDEVYAERYHLDSGFEEWYQGANKAALDAQGITLQRAKLAYRQMWIQPGEGQLREYLHRLRPGRVSPDSEFTATDFIRLLEASSISQPAQKWAQATAYRVLPEGTLTQLLHLHMIDATEYQASLEDLGYAQEDAHKLTELAVTQMAAQRQSAAHAYTPAFIGELVRSGLMQRVDAKDLLSTQGFTDEEANASLDSAVQRYQLRAQDRGAMRARSKLASAAQAAYTGGVITTADLVSALQQAGYSRDSALAMAASLDLSAKTTLAERTVGALKTAFMRGEVSVDQAAVLLAQAGITDQRSAEALTAWQIAKASKRPLLATAQIGQLVASELMDLPTAQARLRNLGWTDPDLTLVAQQMAQRLSKARAASESKTASALQRAARQAQKIRDDALRRLKSQVPTATIKQWYLDGVISQQQAVERMTLYGYDAHVIDLYIREWDLVKARKSAQAKGGAKNQPLTAVKQVPLGTVKKWYVNGMVDAAWVNDRLRSYGYEQEQVDRYIGEWDAIIAYRAGKAKPPAPM